MEGRPHGWGIADPAHMEGLRCRNGWWCMRAGTRILVADGESILAGAKNGRRWYGEGDRVQG